jgi:hypothetical protein
MELSIVFSAAIRRYLTVNDKESEKKRQCSIVSQYAATECAIKKGPSLIKNLADVLRRDSNPSMDGWFLEMWFFASLRNGGVKLFDKNGKEHSWLESEVKIVDPISIPPLPEKGVWFKPQKWNQGGYDAVFFDRSAQLVRFVQVTRGDTHSFKIGYFYSLLYAFNQFHIAKLEIVFVVENVKIKDFEIPTNKVTGTGLLTPFGWVSDKEKDKVDILGVNGLNSETQ